MDDLLVLLNDAASTQNWPVLAAGVAVLAVPIVLKALGKSVPGLDQATPVIVGFLRKFKKAPPPEQKPEDQPGLSNVVRIENARREDKGPPP